MKIISIFPLFMEGNCNSIVAMKISAVSSAVASMRNSKARIKIMVIGQEYPNLYVHNF